MGAAAGMERPGGPPGRLQAAGLRPDGRPARAGPGRGALAAVGHADQDRDGTGAVRRHGRRRRSARCEAGAMRPLAPRERKLVAVGLLIGAVAAAWLGVAAPLIGGFKARAERREQLLTRYRNGQRLLAAIPVLRTEAQAARQSSAVYRITAPSEGLAADALKRRLAASLTEAGGAVSAVQQVQTDIPAGWISVRADAQINLTQLDASIRRLENESPYVVVEYVSLGADRALQSGRSAPLDVRLQVSALFHPAPAR
ncbi:hypothetical protein C5708_00090 [Caulobacter sp. CCUG 60055]|nr:hypothetical protein [Caulobacter sp. CCUG 60055]